MAQQKGQSDSRAGTSDDIPVLGGETSVVDQEAATEQSTQTTDRYQAASNNRKRPRASAACTECRRRKTKCDGSRPRCAMCTKIDAECVWLDDDKRKRHRSSPSVAPGASTSDEKDAQLAELRRRCAWLEQNKPLTNPSNTAYHLPDMTGDPVMSLGHNPLAIDSSLTGAPNHLTLFNLAESAAQSAPLHNNPTSSTRISFAEPAAPAPSRITLNPFNSGSEIFSSISNLQAQSVNGRSPTALSSPGSTQSLLGQNDLLDPLPAGSIESIKMAAPTPGGIGSGSLAQQLKRRDGRMTVSDGGRLRWYGATSSRHLSFGGHFQSTSLRNGPNNLNERCRAALINAGFESTAPEEDFALQNILVSLYFQWCNPFFFTTCEDVFHRHWQRYRDSLGGRNGRRASKAEDSQYFSLTLLYAMLAYVAPLSDGMVDPDDSEGHIENCGDTFMARARICLDEELDSPQETTIQALCIMAGREASVGRDARGYAYIGMAMSCALDLGLHADVVPWLEAGRITQEQYRVRIMTWWGLFLYEKLWSLYVGRPSLCRTTLVSVPTPDQLQAASGHVASRQSQQQHRKFLRELIGLLRITDNITESVYTDKFLLGKSNAQLVPWTKEVDTDLGEWLSELPAHLKLDLDGPGRNQTLTPHLIVLHMQYYVTIINLHRPFMADPSQGRMADDLPFSRCASAASKIAQLVDLYRRTYTLRRISVVATHQIFTAASLNVFVLHACSSPASQASDTLRRMSQTAKTALLICLAGLAALAVTQVHARRSYLLVILLMKRWNIALRLIDSEQGLPCDEGTNPTTGPAAASDASKRRAESDATINASEQFETLSRELFALTGGDDLWYRSFTGTAESNPPNQDLGAQGSSQPSHSFQPGTGGGTYLDAYASWPQSALANGDPDQFAATVQPATATASRNFDMTVTSNTAPMDFDSFFDFDLPDIGAEVASGDANQAASEAPAMDWMAPGFSDMFDLSFLSNLT